MRPLELVIEGLRSYTTQRTIDFRDANLMAIIGDTGAGKSSILEAICFALYGNSSWDSRAVKELISHGSEVMKVKLRFVADGHEWEVERTASRGSYPRPVIKLVCKERDIKLDGRKDVNDKIQELVGLDFNAFLGAVMLPQGRFQELLKATSAERTRILKGVFRLDALERMRDWAEVWLNERRPQLMTLRMNRKELHDDPQAEAEGARKRISELDQLAVSLQQARQAVAQVNEQAKALTQRTGTIQDACTAVRGISIDAIGNEIDRLLETEQNIQARRETLTREIEKLGEEHRALSDALKERERGGLGIQGLTDAANTLNRLLELDEEACAAETRREEMQSEVGKLENKSQELAESRVRAEEAHAGAQRQFEAARRDDAAAHLAAHLAPGDTCPVCRQDVPGSFVVPDQSGTRLASAKNALEQARRELDKARKTDDAMKAKLDRKRIDVQQETKAHERARKQMSELMDKLPDALRPADAGRDSVQKVVDHVEDRKRALKADTHRCAELARDLQAARDSRAALDKRLTEQVSLPARDARNQIMQYTEALATLQEVLEHDELVERLSEDAELSTMGVCAGRLRGAAEEALGRAGERLQAAAEERQRFEAQASALLQEVDCDSLTALDTRIGETRSERKHAERDYEGARAQIERARDLDSRIARASALVTRVEELRKLLLDGKFVSYVVERKQQAMLSVASTLLDQMTDGRFGFASDFQIVDKRAGEARSTETLSGGETFLASLALALALVELATRSGGRLDALFLDEGFGALDADALEQAIQALMSQAERGRLVVVISHLQAVAENIDRVLYIMSSPAGSQAHFLDLHERGRFDMESAGLIA
jgi:DNA repair protein SbcC/Rad50